jgi:hypothetical protein
MVYKLADSFIDHLYTSLGTTSDDKATANLHNSQITTAPAKPFPACFASTSRSLPSASNSGDSSVSLTHVIPVQRISRN